MRDPRYPNLRRDGRPPLVRGERRVSTTVSLTREQQIQFRRMGGSAWLREMLNKELENETSARP